MQEIFSVNNNLVKETAALHQKKHRIESGLFLIEGEKGVLEGIKYGIEIKYIFVNQNAKFPLDDVSPEKIIFTDEKVLKKISTTETPPLIVAVGVQKKFSLDNLSIKDNSLVIVLENIKDAGNLGTIIRTSIATGVCGIILAGNCIDLYNPKVVRSSVANLWKIPVISIKNINEIKKNLINKGIKQFLATKPALFQQSVSYEKINYNQPTAIFFGSEAEGISDELANHADKFLFIPMEQTVESLNLSVSVSVVAYQAYLQRRA